METQIKKDIIHYLRTKDLVTLARLINTGLSAEQLKGYVGKLGKELIGEGMYSKLLGELDEEFESKLDEPFYDWIQRQDGWSLLTPELENIVRRSEWLRIDGYVGSVYDFETEYYYDFDFDDDRREIEDESFHDKFLDDL